MALHFETDLYRAVIDLGKVAIPAVRSMPRDVKQLLGGRILDEATSIATKGQQGAYTVKLSKWAPETGETWKRGRVEGFDRVKRGAWDLLYLALRATVGERNQ